MECLVGLSSRVSHQELGRNNRSGPLNDFTFKSPLKFDILILTIPEFELVVTKFVHQYIGDVTLEVSVPKMRRHPVSKTHEMIKLRWLTILQKEI